MRFNEWLYKYKLRLVITFIILCCAIIAYGGTSYYIENAAIKRQKQSILNGLEISKSLVKSHIETNRSKLLFLFSTPPISGLARANNEAKFDTLENTTQEQWRQRLSKILVAYLQNNQEIKQARVILNDEHGKELLRVFRHENQTKVASDEFLQNKRHRDYFEATVRLNRDEEYISDITLNREYGSVEYPMWSTYRISRPIYQENGQLFGFIIINVDASTMFDTLRNSANQGFAHTTVLNGQEYFLLAKDRNLEFGLDLGNEQATWSNHVGLNFVPHNEQLETFEVKGVTNWVVGTKVWLSTRMNDQRYIYILKSFDEYDLQFLTKESRETALSVTIFVAILMLIVLDFYQRHLERLTELNDTQSRFKAIVLGSTDAIVGIDKDHQINSWNPAASYLFGIKESTALSSKLTDVVTVQFDKKPELQQALQDALTDGKTSVIQASYSRDSLTRIFVFHMYPVSHGSDGSGIIGAAAVIRDITTLIQSQNEVIELNESLEAKVKQRTSQLRAEKIRADQANETKSEFVANIAHEIRTPLNGIAGMVELISSEQLTTKQQHFAKLAKNSIEILAVLINDLLDMSKIEAGKLEIEQLPMNTVDAISALASTFQMRMEHKGIDFIVDLSDLHHQHIVSDPHRIKQIITNLLGNAVKFTERGTIKIVVSSKTIEASTDHVLLTIEVQDTGIGISKEQCEKLFKPYNQAESSTARKFGGTGLGLTISRHLAELMNGDINVESKLGAGSCFTVELKVLAQKEKPQSQTDNESCNFALLLKNGIEHILCQQGLAKHGQVSVLDPNNVSEIEELVVDYLVCDIEVLTDSLTKELLRLQDVVNTKLLVLQNINEKRVLPEELQCEVLVRPLIVPELVDYCRQLGTKTNEGKAANSLIETSTSTPNFDQIVIIVADDNEVNRIVSNELLQKISTELTVIEASNGLEVLQVLPEVSEEKQALILMDCQMPELDGYEATKAIRQGEAGERFAECVIIAMTAGVMEDDKAMSMKSGMNDFIAKPLNYELFKAMLLKWLTYIQSK
ncbi:MAG: response regulator [Gammaproteobacteria bacterium]|nr:response regulator [Gammaproteobacteria bacterium]